MFGTLRGGQPLFHVLFGVKTLSGTLLGTAFNESGYGARHGGPDRALGAARAPAVEAAGSRPRGLCKAGLEADVAPLVELV